ncbi:GMC OxRdtase N domain-containing protein [Citrus sinensis]|uniref:GMC OxRdtase N domain-containing protein n=1 Tax=Citrus sinensis TaxID=2711 RepID=A0ACB8LKU4_CITSI|nr:GMC OxRdtase N domain-containing protein [Citrus sinensis]
MHKQQNVWRLDGNALEINHWILIPLIKLLTAAPEKSYDRSDSSDFSDLLLATVNTDWGRANMWKPALIISKVTEIASDEADIHASLQIAQALQVQMEVQRKLHEQIEVQRHLQLRIEAQGKYLQSVLKKAQETLAGYSSSSAGVELAKAELSQLVSMVSMGCPSSSVSELTEAGTSSLKDFERKQIRSTICSMESSLTSSESSGRKEEKQPVNEIGDTDTCKSNKTTPELQLMDIHIHPQDKPFKARSSNQASGRKRRESTISDGFPDEQQTAKRLATQNEKYDDQLRNTGLVGRFDLNSQYQNESESAVGFLLLNLHVLPEAEGKVRGLPHYMTSDVKEVAGKSFDYIVLNEAAHLLETPWSRTRATTGCHWYKLMNTHHLHRALSQRTEFKTTEGRVLGGSSAINGGFYSRASKDFIKRARWDEELVKQAYEWVESKLVFVPELTSWQTVVELGLLQSGILPNNAYNLEHIEGTKVGGTMFDQCGKRHTSADLLEEGNPNNIIVLLNATVNNIIFCNNGKGNESRACGIRFSKSDGSPNHIHEAYLSKPKKDSSTWGDVILSARALGSPQLLLLSGIGPHEHLKDFNIPITVDFKEVGQGMQDNPAIAVFFDTMPQKRLPEPPEVVGIADNFRVIIEAGVILINLNASRMRITAKMAFPASQGKLELNNTDPRRNPSVEFNYLAKEKDLEQCVKMVRLLHKVTKSESVSLFLGIKSKPQENLMPRASSDKELRKLCKNNVRTCYHYHGGCAVGSVVGEDYRVYGVEGLRVIDGSTFRESPGTNPMATLLMLGRYQGIKILEQRKETSG